MTLWDLNVQIGQVLEKLYSMDTDNDLYTEQYDKYRHLKSIFLKYRTRKLSRSEQQNIIINENI